MFTDTSTSQVRDALDRFYRLRDAADDTSGIVRRLQDETRELRGNLQTLVRQLEDAKRARRRDKRLEKRLGSEIEAVRAELQRKEARRDELSQVNQDRLRLVENLETFLTSGGASIRELEAGAKLPKRHSGPAEVS